MARGIPGTTDEVRQHLRDRIKEMEQRLKHFDRREKLYADLKKWMAARKLDATDIWWMLRQMKPTRPQGKPVKSKKPLQPRGQANGHLIVDGKLAQPKGDPEFRRRVHEARLKRQISAADLGKKIGASGASVNSWEVGRFIPSEATRVKLVKELELPASLGQQASLEMERGRRHIGKQSPD